MNTENRTRLFISMKRQSILAALAHHGTLRIGDVLSFTGKNDMSLDEWEPFERSGLIVRFGTSRERLCSLNPSYPALKQLISLIRAIENTPSQVPRLKVSDSELPACLFEEHYSRDVFGPWFQTISILTVAAAGGEVQLVALQAALRAAGSKAGRTSLALAALQRRILIDVDGDIVRIHPKFPARAELIAFAVEFVSLCPSFNFQFDLRRSKNDEDRKLPTKPKRRHPQRYDWQNQEDLGEDRPQGIRLATDGTPLLFGTVARYRVFATLAINGIVRVPDLIAATDAGRNTLQAFLSDGWLGQKAHVDGNRSRRVIGLASGILGRDLLIALLKKMSTVWPVKTLQSLELDPPENRKTVKLSRTFGSVAHSETLLTLKAFGHADVEMITRALPRHDNQEISRSLRMFESFGIVRQSGAEGSARQFSLDSSWLAAAELDSYLTGLLKSDGRYDARVRGAETIMKPRRLKMRREAERAASRT